MSYKNDEWINATGEIAGMLAHLRHNVSLRDIERTAHQYSLIINLVFRSVRKDGMPLDSTELQLAGALEEAIADRFESKYDARFSSAVTSDGKRDIFLFLPKDIPEQELEAEIVGLDPALDFDFSFDHDPDWRPYEFIDELCRIGRHDDGLTSD